MNELFCDHHLITGTSFQPFCRKCIERKLFLYELDLESYKQKEADLLEQINELKLIIEGMKNV